MKKTVKKLMNVYVIIALIGFFSFLYILSFAVINSNISKGSSVEIKRAILEKQKMEKMRER
ncbi:MAG: hypothetical protein PHX13_07155 [Thiovulaceae bacterium]|nr:hypothetical protein [Sulfurimonadaceae bacterium]